MTRDSINSRFGKKGEKVAVLQRKSSLVHRLSISDSQASTRFYWSQKVSIQQSLLSVIPNDRVAFIQPRLLQCDWCRLHTDLSKKAYHPTFSDHVAQVHPCLPILWLSVLIGSIYNRFVRSFTKSPAYLLTKTTPSS